MVSSTTVSILDESVVGATTEEEEGIDSD